jgi:ribonuclease P protein component
MLPKKHRLLSAHPIDEIKRSGKQFSERSLSLLLINSEDKSPAKVGFLVSLKVSKRATERNRLKRTLAGCVFKFLERIEKGYLLLFLVKKDALSQDEEGLCGQIGNLLRRSGILKKA